MKLITKKKNWLIFLLLFFIVFILILLFYLVMIFYISLLYLRLREENTGLSKPPNLSLKVRDIPSFFRNLICLVPSLGQLSPEEVGRRMVLKRVGIFWVIPHCSRFRLFRLLL